MATCQTLIKRALRLLGELNAGRDPAASETADALAALQGLYLHLVASGTLGALHDSYVTTATYTAHENERIVNGSGGVQTITLPTTITDGGGFMWPPVWPTSQVYDYGFCGAATTTRPPRDRSVVVEAGAIPKTYVYDADLASWVRIDTLALTDAAPFTAKLETGMACLLAAHISAEYRDSELPPTVAVGAGQAMAALTQSRDSAATVSRPEFF